MAFLPLYLAIRGYGETQAGQLLTLFLLMGGGFWLSGRCSSRPVQRENKYYYFNARLLSFFLGVSFDQRPLFYSPLCAGWGVSAFDESSERGNGTKTGPSTCQYHFGPYDGIRWGASGLILPLVGVLSETYSLQASLTWLVLLMSPGFLLALALPSKQGQTPVTSDHSPVEIATLPASTELWGWKRISHEYAGKDTAAPWEIHQVRKTLA